MTIDWNAFTPTHALLGGAAIGLASGLYALGNGRIAGIASIVGDSLQGLRQRSAPDASRWFFLAGLLVAPWLWQMIAPLPNMSVDVGWAGLLLAGLLVGVGVRMGNGCTSGHGVCGLSRWSLRSLVNVLAFMGAGVLTVYLLRHVVGLGASGAA
jgi:uncharacterized protein